MHPVVTEVLVEAGKAFAIEVARRILTSDNKNPHKPRKKSNNKQHNRGGYHNRNQNKKLRK